MNEGSVARESTRDTISLRYEIERQQRLGLDREVALQGIDHSTTRVGMMLI